MTKLERIEIHSTSTLRYNKAAVWLKANMYGNDFVYIQVPEEPICLFAKDVCNKKQFEMYKAIVDYKAEHGYAPIYQELVSITGRAIMTVQKRIKELENLGLIEYKGARMISVTGETYIRPLPMLHYEEIKNDISTERSK